MRRSHIYPVCAALLLLGACAAVTPKSAQAPEQEPRADVLAPRELKPGACGLFVWTTAQPRRFILFTQAPSGSAVWQHEGREQVLTSQAVSGGEAYGQYPSQEFLTQAGYTVSLDLRAPEVYGNALRYNGGVLSYQPEGEWERIVPVVGLASCHTP